MDIMRSVVGMVVLLAIAFLLSVNKKSISLRTVGAALLLQIAIGGIMLYFPPGKWAVEQAALGVHKVMSYSDAGSAFILTVRVLSSPFAYFRRLFSLLRSSVCCTTLA